MPKYPEAKMKLVGEDGNAFAIIGRAARALRSARVASTDINAFTNEAMSGDYDHLLRVVMETLSCDEDCDDDEDLDEDDNADDCED